MGGAQDATSLGGLGDPSTGGNVIPEYPRSMAVLLIPIGSMYAIYGTIYHQYTPNVSIYTIHGSYGIGNFRNPEMEWGSEPLQTKQVCEVSWAKN